MQRRQIQLTDEQSRRLRALARQHGISFSEALRRCIDTALARETGRAAAYERARALVGALPDRDGAADLSRRHDDYLDDAFE